MDISLLNKTFVVFGNVTKAKTVLDQELCSVLGIREVCAEVKPPRVHKGTKSLSFGKNLNNSCLFASESDLLCLLANYELPATCPYIPKFTSIFPYFQTCCL